jgi:SNF2 family DNA or RNA helicase
MGIGIDIIAGGVVLEVTGATRRTDVRRRVNALVPRAKVLSYDGRFIVPESLAYLLIKGFSGRDVTWTRAAKELASRQSDQISQMSLARVEVAAAISNPRKSLGHYHLIDKLDDHQLQAVAAISASSVTGLALFDEQGLGKTIAALCAFDRLCELNKIDKLLVVAPKSVIPSWIEDAKRMFHERYIVTFAAGSMVMRRRCIREQFDILICGYETLIAELQLFIRTIAATDARVLFVIDESYFVKNADARRSKAVVALRPHCSRVVILCGTPAPNSPKDLLNQIDVVSTGILKRGQLFSSDNSDSKAVAGKALSDILYLRRLKSDVLPEIPAKKFEKIFVGLRPMQRVLYEKARDELVVEVRGLDDATFRKRLRGFLARRNALLQICSHPGSLDSLYKELPAKLSALDRILQDLIDQKGKKVVIWSFYRYSLEAIAARYRNYGVVRIDGSVAKISDRSDAISRFQNDESVRLFVGNAAAAGAGITLTAAHHAIYESFSNQAAHYMQSVDRIHRRGQTAVTTYYVLLASDTIEEGQFDRITKKEREGRDLLGDRYESPMTRERFLRELDNFESES